MNDREERYSDGKLKASQQRATREYRRRQARLRQWADDIADSLGITREELADLTQGELAVRLLEARGIEPYPA